MAKNYFYNLLLTLANLLFPILSFPYVSRVLGPEGIGKVQFIFSFAQYFATIASFGIPIYGMKEIACYKDDMQGRSRVFSELLVIYVLTSVCLSVLYLAVIYTFPYFNVNRDMYRAALLLVLLGCSYTDWVYMGMEEFKSIALRSVLFKVIGLLLIFTFIKTTADYRNYLYLMMFSFLGNNILSLFLLKGKVGLTLLGLQLRKHTMPLLFIFGSTIAASMYADSDTVLLGFLSNSKTVGLYTAAVKLSKISIPIVTSMGVILMPKIAKYFAEKDMAEIQNTLDQTFRFLVFLGVPIAFGLALLAPEFIALFSGRQFLEAANSMRVLSVLPLIIGFAHFLLFMILVPAGRNREMFLCVIGGLIISLLLNVLLIPILRQVGSAIANVCSETVVTLLYFYFIKKNFSFAYQWFLVTQAIISALIFIPLVWMVKQLELPLAYMLIISITGCALAYITLQFLLFKNNFVFSVVDVVKMKMDKTIEA
ncbi:flippase [uncultured Mucilaginibacter sp.]|uniref:flippase n=1 Tax=uncultured Mucilaginibacter sp. TaxID=797541 RepID=UPI002606FB7D|nr:flippase [uncultured Mucilaginibacter sp.]